MSAISSIKVKIFRRPTLKLKVLPKFPANVVAANFVTLTRNGGAYTFGVDYTVLTPGPISDPTTAYVAIQDQTSGVYRTVTLASLLTSGLDTDLQVIAALTGTGMLSRTASNTWVLRAVTGTANEITVSNGDGVAGNPTLSLPAALTFTGKTVTGGTFSAPTMVGGTHTAITSFGVRSTGAAFDLTFANTEVLTAGRTLTVTLNDASRTLNMGGNITTAGALTTSGAFASTFTMTGTTTVTFPTSGTLISSTTAAGGGLTGTFPNPTVASVPASALPNPSATTLGGVQSLAAVGSKWINTISTTGVPAATQPAFTDISGSVAAAQMPALTGDITTTAGTVATTIGANKVTNAMRAQMAAYTLKGNATGATANEADIDVTALTLKAAPVSADIVLIQDSAAANAYKKATVGSLASAGSVASLNGQTGALTLVTPPQGRLTLTSGVAITASDVTGATTCFYTPAVGNQIPIYDGTRFVPTVFPELSNITTNSAVGNAGPAAVGASLVYDLYVWNNAGTPMLTRSPAWVSDTSRGTGAGTAERQVFNGITTNKFAITNGPGAGLGTLVGTIRSNSSSQLVDTKAIRWVSNLYNAVPRLLEVFDATGSWVMTTVSTWKQAHNGTVTNQLDYLQCADGGVLVARAQLMLSNSSVASATYAITAIGIDSTTAPAADCMFAPHQIAVAATFYMATSTYSGIQTSGRHTAVWLERYDAGTQTGYGTGALYTCGIMGEILN